jgi:hypothetical protein
MAFQFTRGLRILKKPIQNKPSLAIFPAEFIKLYRRRAKKVHINQSSAFPRYKFKFIAAGQQNNLG